MTPETLFGGILRGGGDFALRDVVAGGSAFDNFNLSRNGFQCEMDTLRVMEQQGSHKNFAVP